MALQTIKSVLAIMILTPQHVLLTMSLYKLAMLYYSLFVVTPNEIGSLFCRVVLCVLSGPAIIMLRKRELVALLYFVAVYVFGLFLAVPWVGL